MFLLCGATRGQTAPATPAASPLVAPTTTPVSAKPLEGKTATPTPTPAPAKGAIVVPPEKALPIRVTRFASAPVIDGKLDEEVWKESPVFRDFYQIRPGDNIAPTQPTEAMIGYDAKFLYLAFRVTDAPGKVRATVAKRDSVFEDDWVGVILDTFNDKRRAYQFFFNPLGVQADAVRTEDGNEDFSVDVVMESKGVVGESGYTVEVAIPFKSLRYEAGKGKLWGVHIIRVAQSYNGEQSSWMPISRDNSSTLGQAGHITGIEDVSTERTLELIPSLTLSETGRRVRTLNGRQLKITPTAVDPGRFVNGPIDLDPGLTAKFGLSPTVTLDLALNPDFAQVEADATVVTANQRFPIFFEEKRPFFLENIDIFRTQIAAVNTRTIVDPDVAV
ncbi:MAG TPA: sugar-binding protein, partial [Pyrinomonadaceae bacterium]|nr:sugar-binding protein [Pyrinomonadaceae bacterium]